VHLRIYGIGSAVVSDDTKIINLKHRTTVPLREKPVLRACVCVTYSELDPNPDPVILKDPIMNPDPAEWYEEEIFLFFTASVTISHCF